MKKILTAFCAGALMVGAVSCNKTGSTSESDKAFGDTVSITFGRFLSQQIDMQANQISAQLGDAFNKDKYLRGVEAAMNLDTADISYTLGYQLGSQVITQLYQWNQSGVPTDPQLIMRTITKSMNDTTINPQEAYMAFQMLGSRIQERAAMRQREANKEIALENGKKATDYVNSLKASDSAVQTTESGLSYKIENPGSEEKPDANAVVKVIYTGRHIDGTEFDSNSEGIEFPLSGVVKGFAEGLQLIGKGGKATLYIPGELAYGPDGQPQAGIGPNEMLVFDVEIVDFTPAPQPAE